MDSQNTWGSFLMNMELRPYSSRNILRNRGKNIVDILLIKNKKNQDFDRKSTKKKERSLVVKTKQRMIF